MPKISTTRRAIMALLLMLMLALATRALMAQFVAAHFTDAAWFQYGSYAVLDERAQNILDGKESPIWIEDASRTDMAQYPPGFPLWMALIYKLTGVRSPSSVQSVQWVMVALAVAPVIIRNLAFWPEFVPTGLSVGTNLWEGIGETERGSEFGAFCCDQPIIEEERRAMNLPQDFPIKNFWPDGIRRDRERGA